MVEFTVTVVNHLPYGFVTQTKVKLQELVSPDPSWSFKQSTFRFFLAEGYFVESLLLHTTVNFYGGVKDRNRPVSSESWGDLSDRVTIHRNHKSVRKNLINK